jgi:hypothetical protein
MSRLKSIALAALALLGTSLLLSFVGAGKLVADTMKPSWSKSAMDPATQCPYLRFLLSRFTLVRSRL